jgi:DNA-directed RNA polymerase subunit RPC12/RpoP
MRDRCGNIALRNIFRRITNLNNRAIFAIAASVVALTCVGLPGVASTPKKTHHVAKATKVAAATYVCTKCGMTFSAADAKKDHYKCTMDGGKLVPQKAAAKSTM